MSQPKKADHLSAFFGFVSLVCALVAVGTYASMSCGCASERDPPVTTTKRTPEIKLDPGPYGDITFKSSTGTPRLDSYGSGVISLDLTGEETLRDRFAMAALAGLAANSSHWSPIRAADAAYQFADAMMAARRVK